MSDNMTPGQRLFVDLVEKVNDAKATEHECSMAIAALFCTHFQQTGITVEAACEAVRAAWIITSGD